MDDMWVNLYNRPNRFRPSELFRASSGALFFIRVRTRGETRGESDRNNFRFVFGRHAGRTYATKPKCTTALPWLSGACGVRRSESRRPLSGWAKPEYAL